MKMDVEETIHKLVCVCGNNINNTISYPGSETEQDCGNSTPTSSWKP